MCWGEFKSLLAGLSADTPLGRVVQIRSEDDKEMLKNFTPGQRAMRAEWRSRLAENKQQVDTTQALDMFKQAFVAMAGKGG